MFDMRPLPTAIVLVLAISTSATAQVLDDDLEFENHVATIEIAKASPVLENVGLSRELTYEAHFEGTLYLSIMADAVVDPFLQVEDEERNLVKEDDDSGGGKHAF